MIEVVERLRAAADTCGNPGMEPYSLYALAATEIEALRARLSQAGAGGVVRSGADMIKRHRFALHADNNCAEIDSNGLAEEIDAALAALAASPSAGEPDMRRVCEELGFDPTNHHNAALCPYCTPPAPVQTASVEAVRAVLLEAREYAPRRDGIVGRIDAALASLTAPTQGEAGDV